jgi:CheY-like chemotaxis protein
MPLHAVIIVEDEADIREMVRDELTEQGFRVMTAVDGEDALKIVDTLDKPCLFLVDLLMPNLDGWAFLEKLREHQETRNIRHRALVISGSANAEEIAHQQGAGFVAKPFEMSWIVTLVGMLIDADS